MKKFGKKGQGAMEYLMTYGWAILVVMIVGVVLWQLGIFNLGGAVSKTMSGFGALKPLDWSITSAAGTRTVTVVNGEGSPVTVSAMGSSGDCSFANTSVGMTILPDGVAVLGAYNSNTCGSSGSAYRVNLHINYTKTVGVGIVSHSSVGILKGTYE